MNRLSENGYLCAPSPNKAGLLIHWFKPRGFLGRGSENLLPASRLATLRSWLLSFEIYLIIFVAAFLRLYRLNTTEFDNDQANFFQMARYAVTHGFIPATANIASVGPYIPPATIDIFMLPAALTNDPLWGAITVGMLMTVSVLLTYAFVRLYYGRIAATIASLIYATLFRAVVYSRFIWNTNLLPLFIVLFFMALFWGVVARRKGWLFPALLLLGVIIQLHATGTMLMIPFAIALVLAPGTIRWRDLVLGLLFLLIIYAPYLLFEEHMHFKDIYMLEQLIVHPKTKASFDNLAWLFYQGFLNPYNILSKQNTLHWRNVEPYLDETSQLWRLAPYLAWISQTLVYLVVASIVTALVLAAWAWEHSDTEILAGTGWGHIRRYWQRLYHSPYRCGLIVLLSWQIVPLIILSRHSLQLYLHYFIFFMPGPCILVSIFLTKTADAINRRMDMVNWVRTVGQCSIYALAALIIIAQFIGSTVGIHDIDDGNYSDAFNKAYIYSDLRSLRNALTEADQVAQRRHLNRVYISAALGSLPIRSSLDYLSTQMHTPTTILDSNCIMLPSPAEGPAVMLVEPYSDLTTALLTHFATATLIGKPTRPGGAPFSLYIITPQHEVPISHAQLSINHGYDLQLDANSTRGTAALPLLFNHTPWIATRWSLLRSASPNYNRTYNYSITMSHYFNHTHYKSTSTVCSFTALRASDQILIPFQQDSIFTGKQQYSSPFVSVNGQFYETNPLFLHYKWFSFLTFAIITTQKEQLYTPKHNIYLNAQVHILASPSPKPIKKYRVHILSSPKTKPAQKQKEH